MLHRAARIEGKDVAFNREPLAAVFVIEFDRRDVARCRIGIERPAQQEGVMEEVDLLDYEATRGRGRRGHRLDVVHEEVVADVDDGVG